VTLTLDWDNSFYLFFPRIGKDVLKFIVQLFALIGFFVVALIVGIVLLAYHAQNRKEPEPASIVLTIDFNHPIVEQNDPSPFNLAMDDEPMVLLDVLSAIDHAAQDSHVKGIAARFGTKQPSLAQAQEIRAALARIRASGKFTYAYGTDFGEFCLGNRAYFLASAFENIWLQPVGTVSLTGVSLQSPFAKAALDKIGVVADFMQREEYKSFMEIGQRENFSPLVKAEMQTMIDNLSDQIAGGIASSRKWDIDRVKGLMARGPYTDEEAVQEGLVTRLAYADEFDDELDRKAGKDAKQIDVESYLAYAENKKDANNQTSIALIYGTGIIVDKSFEGGSLAGEHIMGADTISGAFADAVEDEDVKAIIFRIDSPGGSPAASETIRHAMIHAQKQGKPVIVSMGETAASGGYWIAMNGDRIIADPATLTGSIGVVAGKFADEGLLQKIGVSIDGVSTAANAGMWNMTAPFSPVQRARVNALLDNTYRSFVGNVSTARKIPMEKMPDIAKGRVFTGEQAVKIGLVDELGGYDTALSSIRKSLKLDEKAVIFIETFPAPPTPAERLLKLMRRFSAEGASVFSSTARFAKAQAILSSLFELMSFTDHPIAVRMRPMEAVHD
jgi:protease IV